MSVSEIEEEVPLDAQHVFQHGSIVRPEIERFRDNFERNQRQKEFDGLIRKNHKIYEANDCMILPLVNDGRLNRLTAKIDSLTDQIQKTPGPHFKTDSLSRLDLKALTQTDIMRIVDAELKARRERLDTISENSSASSSSSADTEKA